MGRVHLVSMGPDLGGEPHRHMLAQLDADSNMGASSLKKKRGPYRANHGRSRIMDRSAHVMYRRRGYTLEITIKRGVNEQEMDTLIGKLGAHLLGSNRCKVTLISGRHKNLGDLSRIDLGKLRKKLYDELDKRATIGLTLTDIESKGLLHKGFAHEMKFKRQNRKLMPILAK